MKRYFLRITSLALLAFTFLIGTAQQAQTAATTTSEAQKVVLLQKVNEVIANLESVVKISDEQKTLLQSSLLAGFIKFDNERAAIKGDDTKLAAWRGAKMEDIKARVKAILTPEQYEKALNSSAPAK